MYKLRKAQNTKLGERYIRYLISYMTILLIPLIILTIFYSSHFIKKFYNEIYETVDLELLQISTQLENELTSMQHIVAQLTLTGSIQQAAEAKTPLDLNSTITYLSGFSSANSFIEDIILVLNDNDYVTTCSTTCKKDYFFSRIFTPTNLNTKEFQSLLQSTTTPNSIPLDHIRNLSISSVEEDAVIFSYPLFTDYQKYEGTALFYVRNRSIYELLSQKLQSYQAQIYIMNPNGTIITATGCNDVMRPFLKSFSKKSEHSDIVEIEGIEYVLRTHQTDTNNWSYFAFIPNKQTTFSQVSSLTKEFLLAIVIILILASFTIFFLQKVNYAPVRRLRDKAKQISPNEISTDELATISNALDYLSTQNSFLSSQLTNSLTAVKNERLYRLFSGDYTSREDFNLDCSELDLSLPHDYFIINILMLHTPVEDLETLAQEVKKQFQIPYIYYYLHTFHPNQIVFLMNISDQTIISSKDYHNLQKYLSVKYKLLTTFGIGSVVDSTERIAQSYMEAASALDYRFVKGNGTIIEFKEVLGSQRTTNVFPHKEFEILRNALLSHNEKNITTTIQTIITFMEQHQLPLYLARSICFDLIHLVNEHCRNQKNSVTNSPLDLSGMETAQEIIQMLHIWKKNLNIQIVSNTQKVILADVIKYLDAHCLGCDFSSYEAAEHFGMTLPVFSKFFKDNTGQNVMDYTIYLRMERAKELLRTTNLPLKEIAEQVGYYNLSSFTRRFKLNQGMTPSEYRKISLDT